MDERRAELSGSVVGGADAGQVVVRWEALGPAVAARLAPSLDAVVDDVVAAVVSGDVPPEWIVGRPNARHGVEHGVRGLLALIARGPQEALPGRGLYVGFGRGQLRAGRSLAGLLAAYHQAARETWHALAHADGAALLPQETLHALGDAILACLAEISAASAEGFAGEQAVRGGDREASRRLLLAALLRVRSRRRRSWRASAPPPAGRLAPPCAGTAPAAPPPARRSRRSPLRAMRPPRSRPASRPTRSSARSTTAAGRCCPIPTRRGGRPRCGGGWRGCGWRSGRPWSWRRRPSRRAGRGWR